MAQFIIVTDAKVTEYRLNVTHIASYAGDATDGDCEATIRMLNGINIDVRESAEAIDRLISNPDRGSRTNQRAARTLLRRLAGIGHLAVATNSPPLGASPFPPSDAFKSEGISRVRMSRNQAERRSPQICGGFVARHDKPALARGALKSPSNENKRQLSLDLPTPDSLLGAEHAKLKRYERQERREQRRIRRRFLCLDCRFDTLDEHYYMVSDELWAATGLGPHDGMLCLYCLEQRIGRRLVFADFTALVPSACAWQAYAATRSRSAL